MRAVLVLFLILMVRLRAESTEQKLEDLGGQWTLKEGGHALDIMPYDHERIWVNGVDVRNEEVFTVRPGDNVDLWAWPNCYRYRIESITPAGVVLTRFTYAALEVALDANRTRKQSGRLLRTETIRSGPSDLPMMIWEDLPNGVELGAPGVYRSKGVTH